MDLPLNFKKMINTEKKKSTLFYTYEKIISLYNSTFSFFKYFVALKKFT